MVTGLQKHNRPQNTLHSAADNDCYRTVFIERNKHETRDACPIQNEPSILQVAMTHLLY